ncbi:MAG: radical SAM protein [Nanoarchaeota archaeon]|nr:B12-binding domain-containing radical SAM protein [Nanoarchaeota archaeon]
MNIVLISTCTYPSDQGIRTISSVLKNAGHNVKLVFMTLSEDYSRNYTYSELMQLMKFCKNSDLIGINAYASTSHRANKIISFLKNFFPETPIVYGGVHATISPHECIKYADIVCVGEGENAMIELAKSIEKNKTIDKIKNLWIKKNEKIIKNPVGNIIDNIDSLPFPDYDIENHFILENKKIRKFQEKDLGAQIFFLTGRGCPYGCDYCSNNFFNELYKGKRKKIMRWHSPEYIIKGILYMKNKFPSLGYFDIRDDTFSLRPIEDIKKFCKLYKEKVRMRFKCLGDPRTINNEKIKLLVDAGCTDIIIGIQGSERVNLRIYHRNQTDADVLRAGEILNEYKDKLAVMYDVIACNPYEKPEDIINLIHLLQKLPKPYFLSVNNLVFFTGSKLYNKAKNEGIIKTEKDSAAQLNYWDRAKHIKLKKKNIYLNLILNLMRGSVTEKRFGTMPNFLLNFLLSPERVKRNLKNPLPSYFVLFFVRISDNIREKIIKPFYRALPLNFKVWYDKVRYKV